MIETTHICDRCKKSITYQGWTAIIRNPKLKKGILWRVNESFNCNYSGFDYVNSDFELCADCTKELKQWLKGGDK